jgi:hypothetical protein
MRLDLALFCCLGFLSISGCEQRIPSKELGTVVFEVPAVPGSDKPPPTPGLEGVQNSQPNPHVRNR